MQTCCKSVLSRHLLHAAGCWVDPISSAAPAVWLMARSSPQMCAEVATASISAASPGECGGGSSFLPARPCHRQCDACGLAGGSEHWWLCSAAVSCHEHSPCERLAASDVGSEIQAEGFCCCGSPEAWRGTESRVTQSWVLLTVCWLPSTAAVPCHKTSG